MVIGVLLAGLLMPVAGGIGRALGQVAGATGDVAVDVSSGVVPAATTITDAAGDPIARVFDQYRVPAGSTEISPWMNAAIVAIEDRRFYSHDGLDWSGTARALVENLAAHGDALQGQGASTITMQYVKNYRLYVLADTDAERDAVVADTVARKLAEVRAARRLEQRLSKQEILRRYLNLVYFGNGAYGVTAAARTYFDTTAARLTVQQAALLAGLVRAPAALDPVEHPAAALARRNLVLAAMVDVGSLTPPTAAAAKASPLGIQHVAVPHGCEGARPGTGFFCRYALDYLESAGLSRAQLRTGGYTIRTTLDPRVSQVAKHAAADQVPTAQTTGIANAVAVVAPGREQHRVLALAANLDYGRTEAAGQTTYPLPSSPAPLGAGSVYKIFTAAVAMARGLDLDTPIPVPDTYVSKQFTDDGEPYTVHNLGDYPSSLTLQQALAQSPNTAFVALEDRIGSVDPIVEMAYRLGMRQSLQAPAGPGRTVAEAVKAEERASFTLGPEPTSPLDLANVAATIMSGGMWCPPDPIASITNRHGDPVPLDQQPCQRAVSEGLADSLAAGLSQDTTAGTAADAARAAGWTRPMIGKTGTTQQSESAAFVGATPQYAGAVLTWSNASAPRPICTGDPPSQCAEGNLTGGTIPARTWFATMAPLHAGTPVTPLPPAHPRHRNAPA